MCEIFNIYREHNVDIIQHCATFKLSKDTRNIIMFGDNKIYKVVFSPRGYERPFFCNPEDVENLSFGHILNDGMESILVNGLRFNEMTEEIIED